MQKASVIRLSKETLWVVGGQAIGVLGSLVLVRILTEHLTVREYGQLALGLTLAGLVNQVIMGSISQGIARHLSVAGEKNDIQGYLIASKNLMINATLSVVSLAVSLFLLLTYLNLDQWLYLSVYVLLFAVFSGYNGALRGIQNAARNRSIVAFHTSLDASLKILFVIIIISWLGSSSKSVIIAYLFSAVIVSISQSVFLIRFLPKEKQYFSNKRKIKVWEKKIWLFSWPFSVWGIFTWIQQASDRWALETFSSTIDVGNYAVLYQLGFIPISLVVGLIITLILPIMYEKAGDAASFTRNQNIGKMSQKIVWLSLCLTGVSFIIAHFFHQSLFSFFVSSDYQSISQYLPYMILAGGFFGTGEVISAKVMALMKTRSLIVVKVGSALFGASANTIGAYLYGVNGVIGGLVLFSIVYLIWCFKLSVRQLRLESENIGSAF